MNKTTKVSPVALGTNKETIEQIVDVKGMKIGRAASKIASMLLGKNLRTFTKHLTADVKVVVQNVDSLDIPHAKMVTKTYARYSGYPGGLRQEKMKDLVAKKGNKAVLSEAVSRMLPRNTLRTPRMKNLIFN
jgi:large subunit ribosomal protein L13